MDVSYQDLNRCMAKVSAGILTDELPSGMVCRHELTGIIDKIAALTAEVARLQSESAARQATCQQISKQEQLYRSVFEHAVVGIMIISRESTIIDVNQAVEYLFGYQGHELKEMPLSDFILPEDYAIDRELLQDVIEGSRNYYQTEKRYARNDGIILWCLVTVFAVWDDSGRLSLVHMLEDISAQRSAELQLELASTHDAMTGLYNRAYFDREFSRLQYSMRLPVSIIEVDVDGLKQVNDSQGHEAGDRLITSVAAILKEAFRGDDTAARVGGDEFSILLPETGEEAVQAVCERLRKCQLRFNEANPDGQVHFSLGSATAYKGNEIPGALKQADERMYAEKRLHKNAQLPTKY